MSSPDLSLITQAYVNLVSHGQSLSLKLQEGGLTLLTALGVVMVTWKMLKAFLAEQDVRTFLATTMPLGLTLGILAWIISDYVWFTSQVVGGFDWIAITLSGATSAENILQASMASLLKVAMNLWQSFGTGNDGPGVWDLVKGLAGGMTFWLKLATILVVCATAIITCAAFAYSQLLVGVALAFGPILLPWSIVPRLAFLADGWVRFVAQAAMMKTVGVVLLGFADSMTSLLQTASESLAKQDAAVFDLVGSVSVLFVCVVILLFSLNISKVAAGLVSGSAPADLPSPTNAAVSVAGLKSIVAKGGAKP